MFSNNPFAAVAEFLPAALIQGYIILMALAVIAGTLFDVIHKGSAKYFAQHRADCRARAKRPLGAGDTVFAAVATVAEAAVSGEFNKWPRRASHLLMMYGFVLYIVSTVVMIFAAPAGTLWPALWTVGAFMVLLGGLWFFFFLRVNVAYDGASPLHLGRADLFVGSLIASVAFALVWHYMQTTLGHAVSTRIVFAVYIFFTTLLFVSVPWSKFAHMFFKPAVAFQRRLEEADGSSDLPSPASESFIVRS